MASVVQFVDSIATSPTVRLDLNSYASGLMVADDGIDLSPPPLRRSSSSSMMAEGENVTAAVAGNRLLKLPVRVLAATGTAAASVLANLARELSRSRNILRVQLDGMSAPVFFRTYAAPDYTLSMLRLLAAAGTTATLEIAAEPYARGLPVVIGQSAGPENANPYFETNVASWSGVNGASPTRSTAQFHQGVASMLVTPDGVTASPRVQSEALPTAPGRYVVADSWLRSPGTPTAGMTIRWYSDAPGTVFISKSGTLSALVANTWTESLVDDAAPATAVSYRLAPEYSGTPSAATTLFVDEATSTHNGDYLVNNDPAATVNPCILDVTGVAGEVETPAKIELSGSGTNFAPVLAVRRHGTPGNITPIVQAESMTQGTDTTSGADAAMSAGTRSRCTFATASAMTTRLTGTFPSSGAASVDRRGLYRMFLMVASSAGSTVYAVRMVVDSAFGATTLLTGDTVTYTATGTSRQLIDLGLLQVPLGRDPVFDGYGPETLTSSLPVQFQAQRVSGAGSLDMDFAAAVYADEEQFQLGTAYATTGDHDLVLDGVTGSIWVPWQTVAGEVHAHGTPPPPSAGFIPRLSPGQTNRLMLLRPDGIGTGLIRGPDTKTRTTAVRVTYWPAYLTFAP